MKNFISGPLCLLKIRNKYLFSKMKTALFLYHNFILAWYINTLIIKYHIPQDKERTENIPMMKHLFLLSVIQTLWWWVGGWINQAQSG